MSATEIIAAAMALPSEQRADMAMRLLMSLDDEGTDEGAEEAWRVEVQARLTLANSGQLEADDWRESMQWLRGQLKNPAR